MRIVSSGRGLNSPEFYRKKQKKKRIQFTLCGVLFLSVLGFSIYFSRQERFLIGEVIVPNEDISGKEEVIDLVGQSLTGYYLLVFPRSNAFIYPRRTIEESLITEFPKFKSVDLDLSEFRTLNVSVEERTPFALYCVNVPSPTKVSDCFFMDKDGFIFEVAPSFSSGVYFIYTNATPIENPLGKRFMTVEEFRQLSKFIENLTTLNISATKLLANDYEYALSLQNNAKILWRKGADFSFIWRDLEAFLTDDAITAQVNFLDKIFYLDLRTENKVFYRLRN